MMLSVLLAAAAPARAGTVHFTDVMRAFAGGRGSESGLRLRAIRQQGGMITASGVTPPAQGKGGAGDTSPAGTGNIADASTGNVTTSIIGSDPGLQGGSVETIDIGDVTGTVCDCGEIPYGPVPAGGFPLWPLIGLAGVPLFFLDRGGNPPNITPPPGTTPTPQSTSPPSPIPEPATLLLFGSGLLALGAGARRRRAPKRAAAGTSEAEVV